MTPERLAEIRDIPEGPARSQWWPELLAAHDALTAQVAALTAFVGGKIAADCCSIAYAEQAAGLLADTAAAAEAFKRQQRLEGARELAARFLAHPQTMADALAEMEREAQQ